MNLSAWAGRLAGAFSLAAFVPYIYSTLRGRTKPNRATWWIWTFVGILLGSSYYSVGAHHTIWVPVSYVLGPLVTALLSLRYGVGGWTRLDLTCMVGAGASALLWWHLRSSLSILAINLIIDLLGALPTLRKTYLDPTGEDPLAWTLFLVGNSLNLLAIEKWTLPLTLYPVYMFTPSGLMVLVIFWPRKATKAFDLL